MLVYNYSKGTNEYTGSSEAYLDPEETKSKGYNVYLLPAYATFKVPLETQENQINIFKDGNWIVEDDFRGQLMVNESMIPEEIKVIGSLPEGYALITQEQIMLIKEKGTNYFIIEDNELVVNSNYEQEEADKEAARIQALYMTRSDFFDGTIKAFGADSDDLLAAIQAVLATMQISEIEKKVAVNNYKNALNFYRKHPLFTLLSDIPIPVSENVTILITSEQWDKFFDATDKKDPEAYKYLLPPIEAE